jgi:TonB-linked SusC/RagA family outer membrane protein
MRREWFVRVLVRTWIALALTAPATRALVAQDTAPRDATMVASAVRTVWVRVTESKVAPLRRPITLDLEHAPLADALDAIGRGAGIEIAYGNDVVGSGVRVSLHVSGMTAGTALAQALLGTHLTAYVSLDGRQMLVRAPFSLRSDRVRGPGTIVGRVTDAASHLALERTLVRLEELNLSALTDTGGRYRFLNVPPGSYRVVARRLGYLQASATVAVDSGTTPVDFALTASATRLDQIVTTAVGDRRAVEVGNVISTINADSIAPTAPVTSLTDLISGRAPGVEVLETSGLAGSGEAIRIRGESSLVLQGDPILIVDGVREDNSAGGNTTPQFSYYFEEQSHPTPSRLNDLDFSQIESIEVLKGPSATTEYGTDAANGVLVITTKRGQTGQPQWSTSAEETASQIPTNRFQDSFYSWGHTTNGAHTPVQCPFYQSYQSIYASTAGTCVVDSVTHSDPLTDPATTIYGTGYREKYGLQVSGGSQSIRYFLAGNLADENGDVRVPEIYQGLIPQLGLPKSLLDPNSLQQRSVRGNTTIELNRQMDVTFNGAYLSTYQQTPDAGDLVSFVGYSGKPITAANGYGWICSGSYGCQSPATAYSSVGSQQTDRFTGGLTANWRPTDWFTAHATVGVDHGSQAIENIQYGELVTDLHPEDQNEGSIGEENTTQDIYTVDLRGSARAQMTSAVRTTTSLGFQLVDTRLTGTIVAGEEFSGTPSLSQIGADNYPLVSPVGTREATMGGYVEEEASLNDRLFLIGALRVDAGSGFGSQVNSAAYPKASVSWLALGNTSPTSLRLRGSYGQSGVQPLNGAGLQLWTPTTEPLPGNAGTPASTLSQPGNPIIKPERSAEFEGGFDLGVAHHRLDFGFTMYSKLTHDALVNTNLGWTIPYQSYQENVGEVLNDGIEADATAILVQSRAMDWTVTLTGSWNNNKLLSFAPGVSEQSVGILDTGDGQEQFRVGYPLYSFFGVQVDYVNRNHGIILPSDLVIAPDSSYAGNSLPARKASLSTSVGFFQNRLRLNALFDYQGGFKVSNGVNYGQACNYLTGAGQNDPHSPAWEQAFSAAAAQFIATNAMFENGDFVRFRELGLTYSLPDGVAHLARVHSLSLTAAVRNLWLWTGYSGPDPETTNDGAFNYNTTAGVTVYNNDLREDEGNVPLARYFVFRLNLGL